MPAVDSPLRHQVRTLYRQHHGWLLGWLRGKLGCPDQAADLAQDTFTRLLGGERNLTGVREPRAYLTTVAHGLVVDFFRRRDLERAYLAELALQPEALHPSPEERSLLLEALAEVDRLLAGLSGKARAAYFYSRLDGLTHAEIAEHLGVSVPRVRQYLAAAARHCYCLRYGSPQP